MIRKLLLLMLLGLSFAQIQAQVTDSTIIAIDTIQPVAEPVDSLRIINLNPYITLHVDSMLNYEMRINKDLANYYWFLKNPPLGLRINKDNGTLTFKAEKNYFLSGKLKYDYEYKVNVGVQSLYDPRDRYDTAFTLVFYNTEIIPSKVKPSVSGTQYIDEGETVSFKVQCEGGSFPIEDILFISNIPISSYTLVKECNDEFKWTPSYEFVKDNEKEKEKTVILSFIGSTRFKVRDTATVKIVVKDALNYPHVNQEFNQLVKNIQNYIMQLKYAFLQLDKRLKKVKSFRTTFDLTSGSTALAGTILNSSSNPESQKVGKILPSVGVALVPVKEAAAPNKNVEQNQAALIRTSIKRLEYMLNDNYLIGDKDPDAARKTNKLREELKQVQIQLIDIPVELSSNMSEEELNNYFNSPRVNKKYRLKRR